MRPEQVPERGLLRDCVVQPSRQVDRQPRGGLKPSDLDQLVPVMQLGEIEDSQRLQQIRFRLGKLDRLGSQTLLEQPVTAD